MKKDKKTKEEIKPEKDKWKIIKKQLKENEDKLINLIKSQSCDDG